MHKILCVIFHDWVVAPVFDGCDLGTVDYFSARHVSVGEEVGASYFESTRVSAACNEVNCKITFRTEVAQVSVVPIGWALTECTEHRVVEVIWEWGMDCWVHSERPSL